MKKLIIVIVSSVGMILNAENYYNFSYDINIKKLEVDVKIPSFKIDSNTIKNSSEIHEPYLYLPIFKKLRYEYSYESTNFVGKKKIVVEFTGYSEKDSLATAKIVYYNKKDTKAIEFSLKITEKGILATDSILGGERIEIPIPLFKDKRWTENDKENRVIGFSSKAETPYGNFTNCLKILTNIKGNEIGKRERYYAPNIGLVKEIIKFEEKTDIIELEKFEEIK
ncbi:MAG: hypothetical protein N2Z20_04890 [Elusimicrobiales bacterium]|nr:hypothetical protein [Elusimicrobiales bacterium]